MTDDPTRRRFLKIASCSMAGGGLGLAIGVPTLRLLLDPAGKQVVTTPSAPLDLGPIERFVIGGQPQRVEIIAPVVKDAWTAATDVVLGAAWVQRSAPTTVEAFSAVCPHLGCAVGWTGSAYLCPCHDSTFAVSGERKTGPSERGLDRLPIAIKGDRLELTWVRYKLGGSRQEPA
jgi:menaquinol-cytochrome c reductase iron-sulfur subunit